jgi:hypothetical protein
MAKQLRKKKAFKKLQGISWNTDSLTAVVCDIGAAVDLDSALSLERFRLESSRKLDRHSFVFHYQNSAGALISVYFIEINGGVPPLTELVYRDDDSDSWVRPHDRVSLWLHPFQGKPALSLAKTESPQTVWLLRHTLDFDFPRVLDL